MSALPARRAPYGHAASRDEGALARPWAGETYYERPAIQPSPYGWRIAGYFFLGGLAGAAQVVATLADLAGRGRHRRTVRAARYLSAASAVAGSSLLIVDLHTPSRWFNMFRIFRPTSPMSIGSWTLGTLGVLGGAAAAAQAAHDATGLGLFARLARWVGVPAAGAGGLTAVYTGALVSSTSVPLWAAVPRLMPPLFGASAVGTTAAALTLAVGERERGERSRLERVGLLASVAELGLTGLMEARWRRLGLAGPLDRPRLALAYRGVAQAGGMALPAVLHASGAARSSRVSRLAAVAALVGGLALRAALVFGGNASASRPRDYFRATQPPALGNGHGR